MIENIINDYDKLYDGLTYRFPYHICKAVIKKWIIPNFLEIYFNISVKVEYMNNMRSDLVNIVMNSSFIFPLDFGRI